MPSTLTIYHHRNHLSSEDSTLNKYHNIHHLLDLKIQWLHQLIRIPLPKVPRRRAGLTALPTWRWFREILWSSKMNLSWPFWFNNTKRLKLNSRNLTCWKATSSRSLPIKLEASSFRDCSTMPTLLWSNSSSMRFQTVFLNLWSTIMGTISAKSSSQRILATKDCKSWKISEMILSPFAAIKKELTQFKSLWTWLT